MSGLAQALHGVSSSFPSFLPKFRCPSVLPRLLLRGPASITQYESSLHPDAVVILLRHRRGMTCAPSFSSFSGSSLIKFQLLSLLSPPPQLRYSLPFQFSPGHIYQHLPIDAPPPPALPTFPADSCCTLHLLSFPSAASLTVSQACC